VTTPRNNGKTWTSTDDAQMNRLIRADTPTPQIARALGRTEAALRTHASEEHKSLMPRDK